jgi:hypothetical protein
VASAARRGPLLLNGQSQPHISAPMALAAIAATSDCQKSASVRKRSAEFNRLAGRRRRSNTGRSKNMLCNVWCEGPTACSLIRSPVRGDVREGRTIRRASLQSLLFLSLCFYLGGFLLTEAAFHEFG